MGIYFPNPTFPLPPLIIRCFQQQASKRLTPSYACRFRRTTPSEHGLARRPGDPVRGGAAGGDPVRARPRPGLHAAGRGAIPDRRPGQELRRHLRLRHRPGARLQPDVRAVRPVHHHVVSCSFVRSTVHPIIIHM